jgi:hypothetical protein
MKALLRVLFAGAGIFLAVTWISFLFYSSRLAFHQKKADNIWGFSAPMFLLSQPDRLTQAGNSIRKRALISLGLLLLALVLLAVSAIALLVA